jgi:hypothetical protein
MTGGPLLPGAAMDQHRPLNPDAITLEDEFFLKEDARLLEKLRQQARQMERRAALRQVAPHADDALLDHFISLDIKPETVLAIVLVPLAAVAWADGQMDEKEKQAVLRAASERGITPGTPAHDMLMSWMNQPVSARLMETWKKYVAAMWAKFEPAERKAMHDKLTGMAREVAKAAGGFLGIGPKISAAEQRVLDELDKALS